MAEIWLARLHAKPEFEKLFAIKTILASETDNDMFRTMFLDEVRIVSRIEHPNVVRVTDVGEHESTPYLVMELIEGESLDKLVRQERGRGKRLPLGIILRIMADACHGLGAAHDLSDATGASLHVVHRDVSPHNILVTTSGVSKVIDFGIAKARNRSLHKTQLGYLKGKVSYMPPEQAMGEDVDARADTWALGAVLYFLFTGRPPHRGTTELAVLRLAMNAAPIDPLPDHIPKPVRDLVEKALSYDPAARFQNAADMASSLESVMRQIGAVVSHREVGEFLRQSSAERLEEQRALVAQAIEASTTRRSQSSVAIPIEVDDSPGHSSWGPVVSAVSSSELPRGRRSGWAALAFAALTLANVGAFVWGRGMVFPHRTLAATPHVTSVTTDVIEPTPGSSSQHPSVDLDGVEPEALPEPAVTAKPAPPTIRKGLRSTRQSVKNRDDEAGF